MFFIEDGTANESWHRSFHFQLKPTPQSTNSLFGWQSQTVTVALMNICCGALAEREHSNISLYHFSSAWTAPITFSFLSHILLLETLAEQCKEIWTAFGEHWEEWIITPAFSVFCGGKKPWFLDCDFKKKKIIHFVYQTQFLSPQHPQAILSSTLQRG